MIPTIEIPMPYVIQSGFEYMKEDCGPITECPWRWKIRPKINTMVPIMTNDFTPLIMNMFDFY